MIGGVDPVFCYEMCLQIYKIRRHTNCRAKGNRRAARQAHVGHAAKRKSPGYIRDLTRPEKPPIMGIEKGRCDKRLARISQNFKAKP